MSAELERLRSLMNAQPAELSEAQVDALAEAGNRAVADALHERLCLCDRWPDACVAGHEVTTWDTGAYDIAVPAIVGLWESMRADSVPAELESLRHEVPELRALVEAMCAAAMGPAGLEPQALSAERLTEIAARLDAVASAPWVLRDDLEGDGYPGHLWVVRTPDAGHEEPDDQAVVISIGDRSIGELVESAPADLRALLADNERLRDRIAELEDTGQLLDPEAAAELAEVRSELEHVAQLADEATGWRLEDYQAVRGALHSARLLATEVERLLARVAALESERHTTNAALAEQTEACRKAEARVAELEAGIAWRDAERSRWADVHDLVERAIDKGWTSIDTVDLEVELGPEPTAPSKEPPREGPPRHDYRVCRDLPETGESR